MSMRPLAVLAVSAALAVAAGCEAVLDVDQFPRPAPDAALEPPDAGCRPCAELPCGYQGCEGLCLPGPDAGCKPPRHRVEGLVVSPAAGEAASERTAAGRVRTSTAAGDLVSGSNTVIHGVVVTP